LRCSPPTPARAGPATPTATTPSYGKRNMKQKNKFPLPKFNSQNLLAFG
jgi:hypothetical protein